MMDCIACIVEFTTGPVSPPSRYWLRLLASQLGTGVPSIGRVFPPAVVLEIHCRNSYAIDRAKRTRVDPTLAVG